MTTPISKLEMLADTVLQPQPDKLQQASAVSPGSAEPSTTTEEKEDGNEKTNPTLEVFHLKIDTDTLVVGLVVLLVWVLIWKTSGLWPLLFKDTIFAGIFILFFIYVIANVISAGVTSGSVVYELNVLLTVEQMISILLGSIIVFALFSNSIPVHENCKGVLTKLTMSSVMVLSVSSLWVNVITTGRAFRAIRKFKQGMYNIALALFIIIGLIYIKGNPCNV
jgi:hypothetical protein